MSHAEELPSPRSFIILACVELILGGILWSVGLLYPWLCIVLGVLGLLALWLWDQRRRKLFLAVIALGVLIVVGAGLAKERSKGSAKQTPSTTPAPAINTSPPSLNAYFRADSVVSKNLFFRLITCGSDDIEIVSRAHIPSDLSTQQTVSLEGTDVRPDCEVMYGGSLNVDRIPKPIILVVAYRRRGVPNTLKTTAFFFEIGEATELRLDISPAEKQELAGNQVDNYRTRELDLALAVPVNDARFTLPEMFGDRAVDMGFGAHGKAFLFKPLTRVIAFCARQGGKVSSLSTDLDPAHAGQHEIVLSWNDQRQTIRLKVDGLLVTPAKGNFADEECKRSIRPAP